MIVQACFVLGDQTIQQGSSLVGKVLFEGLSFGLGTKRLLCLHVDVVSV